MRWLIAPLLALSPLVVTPSAVSAAGCPTAFDLQPVGEHTDHHDEHRHVGLSIDKVDRNGNGWICVKHVTPEGDVHVHIDDHQR